MKSNTWCLKYVEQAPRRVSDQRTPITISAYSMIATLQLATDGPFFFDFSTTVQ